MCLSFCLSFSAVLADKRVHNSYKGTRVHSEKSVRLRFKRDAMKYCFSKRVIDRQNQLDQHVVEASTSTVSDRVFR